MEYTKGEWKVDPNYDWVRREDGQVIANCTGYDRTEQRANTHLVAAAPDMYETLNAVYNEPDFGLPGHLFVMVRNALAKAEGK